MDPAMRITQPNQKFVRIYLLTVKCIARLIGNGEGRGRSAREGDARLQIERLVFGGNMREVTGGRVTLAAMTSKQRLAIARVSHEEFFSGIFRRNAPRDRGS